MSSRRFDESGPDEQRSAGLDDLGFGDRAEPPPRLARQPPPKRSAGRLGLAFGVAAALGVIFLASYAFSGGSVGESFDAGTIFAGLFADDETAESDENTPPREDGTNAEIAASDPEPGFVRVDASPWAEITVTDALGGSVPVAGARVTPRRLELPPGTYEIAFVYPPTDRRETRSVTVEPGGEASLRVELGISVEEYFRRVGY